VFVTLQNQDIDLGLARRSRGGGTPVRIARRNTQPDSTPYEGVCFVFFDPQSNQRHPIESAHRESFVETPSDWSTETCAFFVRNCLVADIAPSRLVAIEDNEVPSWLWRKAVNPAALFVLTGEEAFISENSVRDAIDRVAGGWTYLGWQGGYFDSEQDAKTYYDETRWLLCHRRFTPELTEWQQTGVYWAYGIKTAQPETFVTEFQTGLVRRSKAHDISVEERQNHPPKRRSTLDGSHPETPNNLWADSTADAQSATHMIGYAIACRHIQAMIDAYRENQIPPKVDAKASAALRLAIQSARGALVPENIIDRTLDLVEQNCKIKAFDIMGPPPTDTKNAVQSDNDTTVVRLDDELIDLAVDGDDRAYQLFDSIAYGAWTGRKTGIHYATTGNGWNTCAETVEINVDIGDGDFLFLDDTSCPRATIDCSAFRDGNFRFAVDDLCHAVELITMTLDIDHMHGAQISPRTANRVWTYRPLGLSVAGVAELIMSYGLPYDSEDARVIAATICSLITATAYKQSTNLAAEMGAFPAFEENSTTMLQVIRKHRRATTGQIEVYEGLGWAPHPTNPRRALSKIFDAAVKAWERTEELGQVSGYRNAQVTLVSFAPDAAPILKSASLGLEPITALCHHQLDDYGQFKPSILVAVPLGLAALGYSPLETDAYINGLLGTRSLKDAPAVNHASLRRKGFTDGLISDVEDALLNAVDLSQVFNLWILGLENCIELLGANVDELENPDFDLLAALGYSDRAIDRANRYCFGTLVETELPYRDAAHAVVFITEPATIDHGNAVIRMMAAVQPMISGGIGHALALPKSTSVADCHVLLLTGWHLGLKSLCLYRDQFEHSDISNVTPAGHGDAATARSISPSLTVIQGGQSAANIGVITGLKPTTHAHQFSNTSSPVEMSQALARPHATSGSPTARTPIQEPLGKDRTAITLSKEDAKGDAETPHRSSDTVRSAAPGSSSSDATVEQRHI
jgi:hypothetical protein